ncbi:MAG: hypothetical protein ACTSPB_01255 [Candidatus Thorarchaeota archaeon]
MSLNYEEAVRMIRESNLKRLSEKERQKYIDDGQFVVLESLSHNMGTLHTTIRKVFCPLCGDGFNQKGKFGCFGGFYTPNTCGNCGFPIKKTLEEKQDEQHD